MKPILVQKKSTSILQDLFYVVVSESNNSIQLHKPPMRKHLTTVRSSYITAEERRPKMRRTEEAKERQVRSSFSVRLAVNYISTQLYIIDSECKSTQGF